jgi:hypothetical protein
LLELFDRLLNSLAIVYGFDRCTYRESGRELLWLGVTAHPNAGIALPVS